MLNTIQKKFGHLGDKLVVLNPASEKPPQLNFFKLNASEALYFYIFKAIDQSLTPRQATMIAYLIGLLQKVPASNLDTLRNICEAKTFEYEHILPQLSQIEQDFFTKQFMGSDAS